MVFVCHVTLQDHVIKALYVYHRRSKCGDHRHCGSGDIINLVCLVILQDHMIKG